MQIENIKTIDVDFECFMCHHDPAKYRVKFINPENQFRIQLCLCEYCRNMAIESPEILSTEYMRKEKETNT